MAYLVPIWRRSLCAVTGAIVGGFTGMIMQLLQSPLHPPLLTISEVLKIGLILGLAGWLGMLVVLAVWLHYRLSQIAGPALVNSLLSAILTVFVSNIFRYSIIDTVLGIFIGTVVGWLLCLACGKLTTMQEVKP
jgi:hypothetical protein